jgi:hypothetical protein
MPRRSTDIYDIAKMATDLSAHVNGWGSYQHERNIQSSEVNISD